MAVNVVPMHLGLEGVSNLSRGAAESDEYTTWRDPIDVQALRLQPACDGTDIRV